jgi:peptide/nickel transport system ATP-binding protein
LTIALPPGGDRPKAVDDVSFEIAKNEILCLVGESGSGKSVIAQSIMRLLPKTLRVAGGEIRLQGRAAMIFQEPMTALNPVMRCGDQIAEAFHRTRLSPPERRARAITLLREVALPDPERILASYPHQLSGGQRQRVMIAMALALEPALLIADEPTTALDVTTQAQILKLLVELQGKHGMAVLFITHDFGVVSEIAQRVAVLREGRLVETGTRAQVLTAPRDEYTRMLIRAVPTLEPRARPAGESTAVVLEAKGVSKTYHDRHWLRPSREVAAVREVSLVIRKGRRSAWSANPAPARPRSHAASRA